MSPIILQEMNFASFPPRGNICGAKHILLEKTATDSFPALVDAV